MNIDNFFSSQMYRSWSAVFLLLAGAHLAVEVHAATYSWTGAREDNGWAKVTGSGQTNWSPANNGAIPDSDDDVIFGSGAGELKLFPDLDADRSVNSVTFARDESGIFLYKIDNLKTGQNTLSIADYLDVDRGIHEVYCNLEPLNSMTWTISNHVESGEKAPGVLRFYGQLQGTSDVVLTLDDGGADLPGDLYIYNTSPTFSGTIINRGVTFYYDVANSDMLQNAIYKHTIDSGFVYWNFQTLSFRGLQMVEREFVGLNFFIGSAGLEIASAADGDDPLGIGHLVMNQYNGNGIGDLTLAGAFYCDVNASGNDQITVHRNLDLTNASLEIRGSLDYYEERVIATYATRVGDFDTSNLPSGYSVRYTSTQAILVGVSPDVIYVDEDAIGAATGHDWVNAFTSLQDALSAASLLSGQSGFDNQIWVAEGVYHPDSGSDRTASFTMIDGIDLYGGFGGSESSLAERDVHSNITVLSGDIDGNDTKDSDGVTLTADNISGNNSYTVVFIPSAECVLDGFTVTGGSASLTTSDGTRGSYGRGGAVFIDTTTLKTPTIRNCRLFGNTAQQGGAVFTDAYGSVDFMSCDFRGNKSQARGGACYLWRTRTKTTNCNFSGNYATDDGGAIYDDMLEVGSSEYLNCTFTGNRSLDNGGAINPSVRAENTNSKTIINTLIWDNLSDAPGTSNDSLSDTTAFEIFNSCIEHINLAVSSPSNLNGTNTSNAPNFAVSVDPLNAPTAAGDLLPHKNDEVVNKGSNSALDGLAEDLNGNPRVSANFVDMGAFEVDLTSPVLTLLGDNPILDVELDDAATFIEPGFTAIDDQDGDITANVQVIGSVDLGSLNADIITYIVSDEAGNAASIGRLVTKKDTTKPTISAPADLSSIEITSPSGAAVSLGTPTVEDNASAAPTPSNDAPALFSLGTTQVSWTAQDASGNISDVSVQSVQVVDTTDPVFASLPLADINVEYIGGAATVVLTPPSVTDNGDASPSVTSNAPSTYPLGTTVVRWTVTDASGNTTTADQNVVVADTIAPTITAPANIAGLEGNTSITDPSNSFNKIGGYAGLNIGSATNVTDAVDSSVTVTNDAPTIFPLGTTTVTWSATDDAGNVGQATQTVQVLDTVAPVITLLDEAVLQFEEGTNFTVPGATVFDVCDTDIQYTASPFLNAGSSAGVYTVTYNATDESGNVATSVERVVIVGAAPSSVYCVDDSTDFSVTSDIAPAGLSLGDTVTWNSPTGAVTGLTYGINAHENLIEALDKVPNAGTIQIGIGTFEAGAVIHIDKDVTITGSGADMTYLSGAGSYRIMDVIGGSLASHDITVEKLTMTNGGQGRVFHVSNLGQTRLNDVKFSGNDSGSSDLLIVSGDVRLTNCEISGCVTTSSLINSGANSGIYPTFINSTIAGNKCEHIGVQSNFNMTRFENCVIFENDVEKFNKISSTMEFRHCLIQGASSADFMAGNALNAGNIDGTDSNNHPLFLKLDDFSSLPSTTGDYRIASNSPLVDQGDSSLNSRTEDLLGNVREFGSSVDIGAHEVLDTSVQGGTESFIYTDSTGLGSFELNDLVGDFSGSPTTYTLASNSNPDLVGVSLVGSKVNVTLDQVGFASLRFTATNGASSGVHTIHFGVVASPVYVDADATGANTGLSWSDAFTNINDAILAQRPGTAQDVWIADGKYFPDDGRLKQEGDVFASITLTDGVRLYGGFSGVETDFSQRDTDLNLTILSGDIDENDVDLNGDGVVDHHTGITGENTNVMMRCDGVSFSTIVDGLVFTGGYARGRADFDNGPCVYSRYSSLQLHDCLFQGNHGETEGGFMYLEGNHNLPRENYQTLVSGCQFIGNRSDDYSGIYISDGVLSVESSQFLNNEGAYGSVLYIDGATATINHCEIRGNYSDDQGGVSYIDGGDVIFSNCLITGNTTSSDATVAYLNGRLTLPVHVTFRSCTIAGNYCSSMSAGNSLFWVDTHSTLVFENSVVWQNDYALGLTQETLIELEGTLEMRHSLIETFNATDANATSASSYGNMDGTLSANNPLFISSPAANTAPFTGGDYHIPSNAPVVDQGIVTANTSTLDLDGNPRVVNAALDLGCYETIPTAYAGWIANYYPKETNASVVDPEGNPSGNGLVNVLSFITNTDPTSRGFAGNVVDLGLDSSNAIFEFPRRDDAQYLNPVIEFSTDLDRYFIAIDGLEGVVVEVVDDGFGTSSDGVGVDKVRVKIPKSDHTKLFGRLLVE